MHEHMRPPSIADTQIVISKYEYHHHNYQGLGELVGNGKGITLQQLGDPVLYSSISMFNSLASHLTISMNGTSANSLIGNIANLILMNPESVHKAQVFTGSDASILGGSTGPYIYLQENMYSASKPFSRLWYIQGGYDLIGTEGLLTQNLDTNLNVHGSFRRLTSGGMLQYAGGDIWNTRLGVRYSPSKKLQYSLQWIFSNHGANHNGGVMGEYQNPINATILFDNYVQRQYTHQLQCNLTAKSSLITNDYLFLNAYYQNEVLETRGKNPYFINDSSLVNESPSHRYGIQARHEMPDVIDHLTLIHEIGIMYGNYTVFDRYKSGEFNLHAYSYGKYEIVNGTTLRFGMRYMQSSTGNHLQPGFSLTTQFSNALSMKLDFSRSTVQPSIMQRTILSFNETEHHQLSTLSFDYRDSTFSFSIQPFHRVIDSPQLYSISYDTSASIPTYSGLTQLTQSKATSIGIHIESQLYHGPLTIQTSAQYVNTDQEYRYTPTLQAKVHAMYSLYFGASTVTFGCTARIINEPMTMRFVPYINNFAHDIMSVSNSDFSWNGLDLHVSAILGNARVRASIMNLFSATLMDISGYPIQDNIIRLSLNWSFFD